MASSVFYNNREKKLPSLTKGGLDKVHARELTVHSIVYNDMQEVCINSGSGTDVCWGSMGMNGDEWGSMVIDCSIDFLPDAKHLSVVDKRAFMDILSEAAS